MALKKYNHGKFFGPSMSYAGLVFTATGIFVAFYHPGALTLLLPGLFLAFTTNGTIIDTEKKKIRSFTKLFGLIPVGKCYDTGYFSRFTIQKVRSRYTAYSRSNLRLDLDTTDIRLLLINKDRSVKIIINKYSDFEKARNEMTELNRLFFPACDNHTTQG
jgi:hypothetical protein